MPAPFFDLFRVTKDSQRIVVFLPDHVNCSLPFFATAVMYSACPRQQVKVSNCSKVDLVSESDALQERSLPERRISRNESWVANVGSVPNKAFPLKSKDFSFGKLTFGSVPVNLLS